MSDAPRLEPASAASLERLVAWVPDAEAAVRWGGPAMPFPLSGHALAAYLDFVAPQLAVPGALARPGNSWWLMQDDQALGFGQLFFPEPGRVHLARLIITPQRRGERWGEQLIARLLQEAARQHSLQRATLRVYRDNLPAWRLYQRLGFVEPQSDGEAIALLTCPLA